MPRAKRPYHRFYHHLTIGSRRQAIRGYQDKQLEARVRRRTNSFEQAQLAHIEEIKRFELFGRTCARLLHEIANPLTSVSINLSNAEPSNSAALKEARKSLRQMERYLAAARRQLEHQNLVVEFKVQQELRHLFTVLRPLMQKSRIKLSLAPAEPISLVGDPVKFVQIVSNIVVNAIDAYANLPLDHPKREITIYLNENKRFVSVSIKDYGKGITAEEMPHLFDAFFTTKPAKERGLGIGLIIVKRTVEKDFQGKILVSSHPRNGTVFTLRLKKRSKPSP